MNDNKLRQSISDTLDDYTWSLNTALHNYKLDNDEAKLNESQEKIKEKIIDIIINKLKYY